MINAWWLVFIIPMSAAIGAAAMALMVAASRADDEIDKVLRGDKDD